MGWGFNGLFWFSVVRTSPGATGTATGSVMPGGHIGGILGPVVFGLVAEGVSYSAAWSVLGVSAALGAVAMLLGRRTIVRYKHAAGNR